MPPDLALTALEVRLSAAQVRFPREDVVAEYRKACKKYGKAVEVGWLESAWLPRCRGTKRRSRAMIESAVRTDVYVLAKSETEPAGWAAWFAGRYPGIDKPEWGAAPIDIRMRYIKEQLYKPEPIKAQV